MFNQKIFSIGLRLISLMISFLSVSQYSCQNKPNDEKKKVVETHDPSMVKVKTGVLNADLNFPGELVSFERVDLYAKVNSYVKKVWVDVGSQVRKGDLLAELEAPELNAALGTIEAKIKAQEAIYLSSKYTYSKLLETSRTPGTISPNELQESLAKKNSDSAQYISLKSSYQEVLDQKSYLQIRAPFDGIISSRNINSGAYVGPAGKGSDNPLFNLEEQKKLRLVVSVPEEYINSLKLGSLVSFSVRAFPNTLFKTHLSRLGGSLSNPLKSERIEMDVDNTQGTLLPGMTASVIFSTSTQTNTLLVPKSSVMETSRGTFIIKMDSLGKLKYVSVKRGKESNGMLEIFGDLENGNWIVQSANDEIREGTQMKNPTPLPNTH